MITLASQARLSKDVVFHDLQGEMVLLNLKTGVYFGLDPVGSRIWHLLQAHPSLQKVLDSLVEEYDTTEAGCAQDLLSFTARLREKGLVEVSNSAAT